MIFVTVGTHGQPFERLLAQVGRLPELDRVVIQYGPGAPPQGVGRAAAFMPFGEIEECLAAADVVVTHAGVGSILCARRAGHVPIVVPRYHELGEHVDDHQVELTAALAGRGEVVPVWRDEELRDVVAGGSRSDSVAAPGSQAGPLVEAVRGALLGRAQ